MTTPPTPATTSPEPPTAARTVTIAAVAVVGAVAAIVSFEHMREVATLAGEGWRAWLLPLSVDGLLAAASMTLLAHRRAGLPASAHVLAIAAMVLGIAASTAANIAAADTNTIARVVAAWPALAFAFAFELLLQLRHPATQPPPTTSATPTPPPAPLAITQGPATPDTHHDPDHDHDHDLARVRALITQATQAGRPTPGRRPIAQALGVTEHRARCLLDLATTQP